MDDRIDAIDIRLIHLEDLVNRMNLFLNEQESSIRRIDAQLNELRGRIVAVERETPLPPAGPSGDPPTGFNR